MYQSHASSGVGFLHTQTKPHIDCSKEVSATDTFDSCCMLLPSHLSHAFSQFKEAEELRLRLGKKACIVNSGVEKEISEQIVSERDITHVLDIATDASIHSASESISKGFITYRGLRLGLCGQAIFRDGKLIGFRKYTSLAIRMPRQISGAIPENIIKQLYDTWENTLIIGAPGIGKTTALRELIRSLSDHGKRVAVVDERGELAGADYGFELGCCTDIISGIPKAEAAIMLLRGMNPHVIAMDEISLANDIDAVLDIAGCGVNIIATAHGTNMQDMLVRPVYEKLFDKHVFRNIVGISICGTRREYKLERIKQ